MSSIRTAIVGVGNCASSLVQGIEYYKDADPQDRVPGLMHVQFGPYHVRDVEFVAAFDVDARRSAKTWRTQSSPARTTPSKSAMCRQPVSPSSAVTPSTASAKYYREMVTGPTTSQSTLSLR